MIIGDRETVYADVYQSGGLWHFNIHRRGDEIALYASRFIDGHQTQAAAVAHAANLLPSFGGAKPAPPLEVAVNGTMVQVDPATLVEAVRLLLMRFERVGGEDALYLLAVAELHRLIPVQNDQLDPLHEVWTKDALKNALACHNRHRETVGATLAESASVDAYLQGIKDRDRS